MQSPAPSPSGSVRRHGRNISHPTPQRATRGPLEAATDDPLATPASPSVHEVVSSIQSPQESKSSTPQLPEPEQEQEQEREPTLTHRPRPNVDLRFLQDRQIYHSVTTEDIPSAFLNSAHRPPAETSLPDLLTGGHFRRAAEAALRAILQSPPTAAEHIFQLLYTRLACLVLIHRPDIAAAEALPLVELLARNVPGAQDIVDLVPWELRVLLARLQSIGAADGGRRGIMALYALAGEVRANLRMARKDDNQSEIDLWRSRLHEIGLRVCDALVEMGELETATRHLGTLSDVDSDELAYRKALLRVRVGDIAGAERCVQALQDDLKRDDLTALLKVADGDHEAAVSKWQALLEKHPDHDQFALNAAVSLLYTGHVAMARDMLEDFAKNRSMSPTLLFNLSTVYELCTERVTEMKTTLIQQAAARQPNPASGGWERATFDFKL